MIVLSSATTGRPAASASRDLGVDMHGLHPTSPDTATTSAPALDHLIGRVEHRRLRVPLWCAFPVIRSTCPGWMSSPLPGPEGDADFPALVADHEPPVRLSTFGDFLYLADPAFDGGTASRDHAVHRDHRRGRSGCS